MSKLTKKAGHALLRDMEPENSLTGLPTTQPKSVVSDPKHADAQTYGEPLEEGELHPELDEQMENLHLETEPEQFPPAYTEDALSQETASFEDSRPPDQTESKIKAALGEVRHFAGGLIAHPYEATKHYSILRHSHGLVFYQGLTTSIAITIFSDQPLPPDRSLWLQKRGLSGKTGLKLGAALGTRSAWIDVTPAVAATADILPKADERAWQRDINRFLKKAKDSKSIRNHRPCETDVVRIPHVAEDGYFRIVLTAGRKVLCPSPIFRYASSSLDPSHLRGASLSTLPLELGIKISAFAARHGANYAAHGALQPVQNYVQPVMSKYNPLGLTQFAAEEVYDVSGGRAKVDQTISVADEKYEERRDLTYEEAAAGDAVTGAMMIGSENGPKAPFPIRFSGVVTRGSGKTRQHLGMPTANLEQVSEATLFRLSGVYMGWVTISKTKVTNDSLMPENAYDTWYQALVTVAPIRDQQIQVVERRSVSVYLIHHFGGATFFDARLNVMLMAFLHPFASFNLGSEPNIEKIHLQMIQDVATTQASLDRPAWFADSTLERIKSDTTNRSFADHIAGARSLGQRQIDKVPLHRFGVRTDSMGLKDRLIGTGGICIMR